MFELLHIDTESYDLTNVVKTNRTSSGYAYIDTANTFDKGWETMVFECDRHGYVRTWNDLYVRRYPNKQSARQGHAETVREWEAEG